MGYTFKDNHIELDKLPGKFKKLTATRFATVMGLNAWSTPFEAWCEITKTYQKPFEDTVYTIAGKTIEPKVIDYLKKVYFMDLKSPADVYGADYFKKTYGDFFPSVEALGGMWDAVGDGIVVEIKTTKRAEDWQRDVPIYYKLQACLYAYLLGYDDVIVTVSFLEEKDYTNPEAFAPSVENTKVYDFKLSEAYPNFKDDYIEPALKFWRDHVLTGISPDFDEKKDADILKELRKNTLDANAENMLDLMEVADNLKAEIDKVEDELAEKKDRLKLLDENIKRFMKTQFRDGDKKVEMKGTKYTWTLAKSNRASLDSKALKDAGIYDKYITTSEVLTLKKTAIK